MPLHTRTAAAAASLLITGCFISTATAQDLTVKAAAQTKPIAITNATIHTVANGVIRDGYVIFDQGKITAIGEAAVLPRLTADVQIIDARGKHVYPGLIGAYSQLGITEIGSVRASHDMSEVGSDGVSPEVRGVVAVNPDSTLIPVTRSNGVLAVGVFPTGGTIPGRAGVVVLEGWTWEDMTVDDSAGLVVNWPMSRTINAWWMDSSEEDQQRNIRRGLGRVEESFATAKAYNAARHADAATPIDLRWEAMAPVFKVADSLTAQTPLFVMAQDYDQITSAISFCTRHDLKCVIVGGREAPMCAELLKKHDIPVIVIGAHNMPRRDDSAFDEPFTVAVKLQEAGVRWCMASGEETPHERNLPYSAARAVAYGLDPEAAIRSVTLSAAQILGVGDTLGSLETGKSATLIVTDGNPLEVTTKIDSAFIHGKQLDLTNKQTELNEKYREKYRQQNSGSSGR